MTLREIIKWCEANGTSKDSPVSINLEEGIFVSAVIDEAEMHPNSERIVLCSQAAALTDTDPPGWGLQQ